MAREKELYRDQLERVIARWPDRELIPIKDAAQWLGIDSRRLYTAKGTPAKQIDGRYYVSVVALARWLA